jgi:nucleoside-triphosphatase THEP1
MNPKAAIIGLCGSSGSGKTLTCQRLVQELRNVNVNCCGFVSPAVFEGTTKTAIKVKSLESGDEQVLMTPVTAESQLTVGRWQIHPDAFEWIDKMLTSLKVCQAFFCDEIGPLEVLERKGWIKALEIVDERKFDLNVLTFRPSLRDFFLKRYPEMTIYDLDTSGNYEKVICDVKSLFGID